VFTEVDVRSRWKFWLTLLIAATVAGTIIYNFRNRIVATVIQKLRGEKTVADRLREVGPVTRERWRPFFDRARGSYPPSKAILAAFKQERVLQIYCQADDGRFRFIRSFPILGASGKLGPKLKEGDHQVPEGIYPVESLNPNSLFHLALRVGYPNTFDREQASKDGRTELGGDIMIHGSTASIGCLAMGDEAAEDLFVLAAETGIHNITAVISPVDFRAGRTLPAAAQLPPWSDALYSAIKERLAALPVEPQR
jgi:hypothetical protein